MSRRRKAREFALQLLFRLDFSGDPLEWESFRDFWANADAPEETVAFARELVTGTWQHLKEIDKIISELASNWSIERIAAVDRNILRLGVFELQFRDDIPASVSINEALEIAKKFSSIDSASFINGILDQAAKKVRNA